MRTKPKYWYRQSAVIPYRKNKTNLEVLLITTRKKKKWILPKGIIEENLTPIESAQKEALEEAGVTGAVDKELIGKYKYKKWGSKCKVEVYALKVDTVLDKWEEDFRDRKWIEFNYISKYILDSGMIEILNNFRRNLGN